MPKFLKTGKVVIILQGRYAGKKAIIVKVFEEGDKAGRQFPHCLVAGIDRNPRKVTQAMSNKKIVKRSKIKPFVKYVNFNHIMPTRYTVSDIDLKSIVSAEAMKKSDTRTDTRKQVKKVLEDRYLNRGKNLSGVQFFFRKLRF